MNYPDKFSITTFQLWYNETIDPHTNIISEVEKIRKEIANKIISDPKGESIWYQLQTLIKSIQEEVYPLRRNANFESFPNYVIKNADDLLRHYVKSTESIINKMWRINKVQVNKKTKSYLTTLNIKSKIKDLVRFSIKTDSLKTAELFANHVNLSARKDISQLKLFGREYIKSVEMDNELKMESGYFAYHCYFKVSGGIKIEMQIFSELSNYWRKLSHKIYDELRNNPKDEYNFNDVESRVVSIGHLLYLADCELHNIEKELGLSK